MHVGLTEAKVPRHVECGRGEWGEDLAKVRCRMLDRLWRIWMWKYEHICTRTGKKEPCTFITHLSFPNEPKKGENYKSIGPTPQKPSPPLPKSIDK